MDVGAVKAPTIRRSQVMQTITTIGLDIAKSVFQVHGVDNDGKVVIRRQLKRCYVLAFFEKLQPCLVGIEACASSHYRPWVAALLTRRPTKVAAIALANKLARMAWAMMARGERYNYPASLTV